LSSRSSMLVGGVLPYAITSGLPAPAAAAAAAAAAVATAAAEGGCQQQREGVSSILVAAAEELGPQKQTMQCVLAQPSSALRLMSCVAHSAVQIELLQGTSNTITVVRRRCNALIVHNKCCYPSCCTECSISLANALPAKGLAKPIPTIWHSNHQRLLLEPCRSSSHSHPAKPPPQPCCSFLCRCVSS
jgi:hypothetical protein